MYVIASESARGHMLTRIVFAMKMLDRVSNQNRPTTKIKPLKPECKKNEKRRTVGIEENSLLTLCEHTRRALKIKMKTSL